MEGVEIHPGANHIYASIEIRQLAYDAIAAPINHIGVASLAAIQRVDPRAAIERIGAVESKKRVVPATAKERVVALATIERVVTTIAKQAVAISVPDRREVRRADHRGVLDVGQNFHEIYIKEPAAAIQARHNLV